MSTNSPTYDLSLLEQSLAKWRRSPALRTVYADLFRAMRRSLGPGTVLEIGSGIGVARDFFPGLVASDIVATAYVDRAVSAYRIPAEGWGNIIALDVLHHLREPLLLFASAGAALAPGGRLVLAEPAGTAFGRWFYRCFHHEPCHPAKVRPPFVFEAEPDGSFANMGMAHALFGRNRAAVEKSLLASGLQVKTVTYRDVLAYPASGGFSQPALLPAPVLRGLLAVERLLPQVLLRFLSLRMIVVLEKTAVV